MRRLVLFVLLAVLAGACSAGTGGADPTAAPPAEPVMSEPAAASEPTAEPALLETAPAEEANPPEPSAPEPADMGGGMVGANAGDPELNARIPTSVQGEAITVSGFDFADTPASMAMGLFAGGDSLDGWLTEHGKSWRDVSVVTAITSQVIASSPDQKTGMLTGLRVKGAQGADMLEWFGMAGIANGEADTRTIGGKQVVYYSLAGMTTGAMYVWTDKDAVYWLINANPSSFGDAFVAAVK